MSLANRIGNRRFDVDASDRDESEHAASWHPLAAVLGRDGLERRMTGFRVQDAPRAGARPPAPALRLEDDAFESAADDVDSPDGDIPLIASWQLRELAPEASACGDPDTSRAKSAKIMTALALADLVDAVENFLRSNFPEVTLSELPTFAAATRRALASGQLALRAD